jgi:hypothetical protein
MYRSKAIATEEEAKEIMDLYKNMRNTPVIAFGSAHAMTGGASADVSRYFFRRLGEIARNHGLADQRGEWGFDPETRHFLSSYPIVETEALDEGEDSGS